MRPLALLYQPEHPGGDPDECKLTPGSVFTVRSPGCEKSVDIRSTHG
jgi:hypothetical protein